MNAKSRPCTPCSFPNLQFASSYPTTSCYNAHHELAQNDPRNLHLFLPHTSASLVVSENWDPTARADLETFMERLVPERESWYTHDLEGPDDATSHIRAMLTDTSLTVPVDDGNLSLGTWQGIYVFEHRARPHRRKVLMRVLSIE